MAFKTMLPPSSVKPTLQYKSTPAWVERNNLLTSHFNATTILLVGATLQGLLLLAIPRFFVLLPTILALSLRFADTLAITLKLKANPYLEGAIMKKHTVIIPDSEGQMSNVGADEKIAVLLLCIKLNHPLGFFSPHVKTVGDFAQKMNDELNAKMGDLGFLGQSNWRSSDQHGVTEMMLLSYWRSIDDVLAYSQGPLHKETWAWWENLYRKNASELDHIGISHEVFEAPRSKWESVSLNFQPTRLGATTYLRKGDKSVGGIVDDQWINPIVEARGSLRTSKQRLNWAMNQSNGHSSDDEKTVRSV